MAGMTVGHYRLQIRESDKSEIAQGSLQLWDSPMTSTGHKISVAQKVDTCREKLLLIMKEQGRQKLQIKIELFGAIANQKKPLEKTDEALQRALTFMVTLGRKYASGELDENGLKEEKKTHLASLEKIHGRGQHPLE